MTKKSTRVLILGAENCGLIYQLKQGFQNLEYKVKSVVFSRDPLFITAKYDYDFQYPKRKSKFKYYGIIDYFVNILLYNIRFYIFKKFNFWRYDLYVFTWKSLENDFSDLKILRQKNKEIVFLFLGSEIRWIEVFKQQYPGNSYQGLINEDWSNKILLCRNAELYCSSIFAVPDASGLLLRGYFHMFMPLDLKSFNFTPTQRRVPLIIHAPSKRDVKGTAIILEGLNQLKQEGVDFIFELVEGLPNQLLKLKLEEADIVIDQLFLNGPGTLATEAMASGCAVAARFLMDYPLTSDVPMCYIDESCVVNQLRLLITNLDYRKTIIKHSRAFTERHNDSCVLAENIVNSIWRDKKGDFDYTPNFFREEFILPDDYEYSKEIVNYTNLVCNKYY